MFTPNKSRLNSVLGVFCFRVSCPNEGIENIKAAINISGLILFQLFFCNQFEIEMSNNYVEKDENLPEDKELQS